MTTLTEGMHSLEFLVSEAEGNRSRDAVTVLSGEVLKAGHVVARVVTGATAVAAADAGNAANTGALTVDATTPVLAGAKPGVYRVVCVEPGTNVGTFIVFDPDGVQLAGRHIVAGSAFANQIKFTIADGSTDFTVGEGFTVTVAAGSGKVKEYDVADTDGGAIPVGILAYAVDATGADAHGVIIARDAEVKSAALSWYSGADANAKAAGLALLKNLGIIGR